MTSITSMLGKILRARGLEGRLSEYRIHDQWEQAVGEAIARHARPQRVQGKKLQLVVDSPAWMQQLSLMKPELIEKLNERLGRDAVKDITLRLGEVIPSDDALAEDKPLAVPLSEGERARAEQYVHDIDDPAIRERLRRLIERDLMSKKAKAR